MTDLRYVIVEEFVKADRQFEYIFNNKTKLRVRCEGLGCPWILYARLKDPLGTTEMIKRAERRKKQKERELVVEW